MAENAPPNAQKPANTDAVDGAPAAKRAKTTEGPANVILITDKSRAVKPKRKVSAAKRPKSVRAVHNLLVTLGVGEDKVKDVSRCLKAGILNGHVKLLPPEQDPEGQFGLDQVLVESQCFMCSKELSCTVRDVLFQPDFGGHDYESGAMDATFRCENTEECVGIYVASICRGDPTFDSGKFHNHCTRCPKFGFCIGDYRDACQNCGRPRNCRRRRHYVKITS